MTLVTQWLMCQAQNVLSEARNISSDLLVQNLVFRERIVIYLQENKLGSL
jgi:hypothetical protein